MPNRNNFMGDYSAVDCTCDILDKKASVFNYIMYMLDRTNEMFEYDGLPDTIPREWLELYLQINGQCAITKIEGELYAVPGRPGGAPDPYNRPTIYTAALPAFGDKLKSPMKILNHGNPYNKAQDTRGECVLIKNDSTMQGLWYLLSRYATELTENDVSIRSAQINSRQQTLIAASTDRELASAKMYIDGLTAGKLEAVSDNEFLGGIRATNVSTMSSNSIIQLIELQQYLKASWFNDIGLNANFNMKREYQSEEELSANTDVLLPLIDNMLKCRKDAIDVVNSTYGTNITVEKGSSWANRQKVVEQAEQLKDAEVVSLEGERAEKSGGDSSEDAS